MKIHSMKRHPMKSQPSKRLSTLCFVLCMMVLSTSCSEEKQVFSIASGGMLGNYYSVARSVARVANNDPNIQTFALEPETTAGSVANIEAILAGGVAFGIVQADREYQAARGLADWMERGPQEGLRAVFSLHVDSITVVATPESGIQTTGDLVGKRVDIGHPDSGSRKNAIDALGAAGLDWEKDLIASGNEADVRASQYLDGDLDAFFFTVGHPTLDIKFAVNSVPRARLIPLSNIERLLAQHGYYTRSTIPIALYPGIANKQDVETVGLRAIFMTSTMVPDDVVYALTRAVFEDLDSLREFDPVLSTLTKASMTEGMTAPLHSGALRYYVEAGLRAAPAE